MSAEHHIELVDLLFVSRRGRITGDPGIDDDFFASGCVNQKSSMSEPCNLDSIEIHCELS